MKPKFVILCLLAIFLGLVSIVTVAQENNPLVNEDANACYEGGTFAGMCDKLDVDDDGDADSFDSEWCWKCGWFKIRVEYNMLPPEVLDGICEVIPPVVVVEEEEKKDKKKKKEVRPTGIDEVIPPN